MDRNINIDKAVFFDRLASQGLWDDFDPTEKPKLLQLLELLAIKPGMTILEPGCGTGRLTEILAMQTGPSGKVIANDISSLMAERARQRSYGANVEVKCMSAEDLRLKKRSLDRVVCFQSFPHFDNKEAVLKNFFDFLKHGGLLSVVHFAGSGKINNLHQEHGDPISRDLLPPIDDLVSMVEAAGFEVNFTSDSEDGYWLFADVSRHT